jgi:hypothetical protein
MRPDGTVEDHCTSRAMEHEVVNQCDPDNAVWVAQGWRRLAFRWQNWQSLTAEGLWDDHVHAVSSQGFMVISHCSSTRAGL